MKPTMPDPHRCVMGSLTRAGVATARRAVASN